ERDQGLLRRVQAAGLAGGEPRHVLGVLDVDGSVDAQRVIGRLEVGGGRMGNGHDEAAGVLRDREEDDVRDERQEEQQEDPARDPANDVGRHRYLALGSKALRNCSPTSTAATSVSRMATLGKTAVHSLGSSATERPAWVRGAKLEPEMF